MIKRFLCVAGLVLLALSSARAFSLAGPPGNAGDKWQAQNIGYGPPTDYVAPKNIGEGYRRNIPVFYYGYSTAFLDYFGTAGETNIDAAFGLLNNALTNGVSSYSADLGEVPLDSQQINYTAQSVQLFDIKSMMMSLMMPQLGLADPEEYVWKIHDRYLPPGGKCPFDEEYTVVQRNFWITPSDFTQLQYSPYVNNTLYSFYIEEICSGAPVLADTIPFPVDPLADAYTSVAGYWLNYGGYYTGLTSDDIGGLRSLYSTNNVNWETVQGGSLLFDEATNYLAGPNQQFPANTNSAQTYGTFSLASLLSFSTTNSAAAIAAAFPGVVVASSFPYLVLASNATVTATFVAAPIGYPYGTPPVLQLATNYSPYLATNYVTTFANVIAYTSNRFTTNFLMTVTTGLKPGYPYNSPLITTTNYQAIVTTNPSGDFYTLPYFGTNQCGSGIHDIGYTIPISTTNLITSINTNLVTSSNSTPFTVVQSVISTYNSHIFRAYQVNCGQTANATGLYQGIDKIKFIRADYDSLLGQFFQPVTNGFSMMAVTNSQVRPEHFDRLVTVPDVLVDASDLDFPSIGAYTEGITVPVWNQANILPNLAGPGTINPPTTLTFNKVGDIFLNGSLALYFTYTNAFLSQNSQYQLLAYGSFDGSTNDPVVYPNGSSIQNLENQLLVQITPTVLPNGTVGVPYSAPPFTASGGAFSPNFTWSTVGFSATGVPNSGLPPGMTLSSGGVLSGTPTLSGTYDFTLIMTDSLGRSVQWNYTIIIQ